jgi:uncharacterized membrane protein
MNYYTYLGLNVLTGVCFFVIGILVKINTPKDINTVSGYRTVASMKNQDTWTEANKFSDLMLMVAGIVGSVVGAIMFIIFTKNPDITAFFSAVISCALVFLFSIVFTELYLKIIFDGNGKRK